MTRLAPLVKEALEILGWDDDIEDDEDAGKCVVNAQMTVKHQPCNVVIETHEASDTVCVLISPPFRVDEANRAEAYVLINAINRFNRIGRMEMDPEDGELRCVTGADVEGASPTGQFVVALLKANSGLLRHWMWALASVALTGRSAQSILEEDDRRSAAGGSTDSRSVASS